MLFKPDLKETAKVAGDGVVKVASRARRRTVSITITLLILGGLGYITWTSLQQNNGAKNGPPDLPVPVLAATPRIQDVPVYLDGVGAVRALNNVLVRSQVDGKLIKVNFTEGQDVQKGDERTLGIVLLLGAGVGGGKLLIADHIEALIGELCFILCLFGDRLIERRLVEHGIDLAELCVPKTLSELMT